MAMVESLKRRSAGASLIVTSREWNSCRLAKTFGARWLGILKQIKKAVLHMKSSNEICWPCLSTTLRKAPKLKILISCLMTLQRRSLNSAIRICNRTSKLPKQRPRKLSLPKMPHLTLSILASTRSPSLIINHRAKLHHQVTSELTLSKSKRNIMSMKGSAKNECKREIEQNITYNY